MKVLHFYSIHSYTLYATTLLHKKDVTQLKKEHKNKT